MTLLEVRCNELLGVTVKGLWLRLRCIAVGRGRILARERYARPKCDLLEFGLGLYRVIQVEVLLNLGPPIRP